MSNHICPKCETAVIAAWRQELDGNYYHDKCLPFRGLLNQAESELTAANACIAALEALLGEAIESIEDWAGYASEYFREKHELSAELKKYRGALDKSRA